jgi:uncharacterized membrane protein YbhN (UPF0104 family)
MSVAAPAVGRVELRRLGTMALLGLLAVALLASVPGLRAVVDRIGRVDPVWIVAALALELASELSFVAVFRLFFDRVPARDARRLAWTELGSGALLPVGGAGGMAIGAWLMSLTGADGRWIARRSAGLFLLGAGVSSLALIAAGVAMIAGAPGPHDLRAVLPVAIALPITLVIVALPWLAHSRRRTPRWLGAIAGSVEEAERVVFTRRGAWRAAASFGYLGFDIAVLWVALRALGSPPSVPVLVMAYSIGYGANSLPVPGGIGVLDAGLTGALVLYGVAPAHAAAAALLYHAIAFWVPGLGGLYAYVRLLASAGTSRFPGQAPGGAGLGALLDVLDVRRDDALPLRSDPVSRGDPADEEEVDAELAAVPKLRSRLGLLEREFFEGVGNGAREVAEADAARGCEVDRLGGLCRVGVDAGEVSGDDETVAAREHLDSRCGRWAAAQVRGGDDVEHELARGVDRGGGRTELMDAAAEAQVEMQAAHGEREEQRGAPCDHERDEDADRDPQVHHCGPERCTVAARIA